MASRSLAGGHAIVTDGLWRKSLSAIRSLGREGVNVEVMGDSLFTTGFWSRYTRRRLRAPVASRDAEAFGRCLLGELEHLGAQGIRPVLFPMEDATINWVSQHRARITAHADLLLPPAASLEIAQDKGATARVAAEIGIPCPRTWEPSGPDELFACVASLAPGSFVVKPHAGSGSAGVVYGERRTREEWRAEWERRGALLVQERVPPEGQARGVSVLIDGRGECAAWFVHERLREYPVSGGPSTDRRSVHDSRLVELSLALLQRLAWRGIAMVEWKIDPRDGTPRLLEINPRFWGSLELAIRAGVDFPVLYARAAAGHPLGPPPTYPDGVRCRWLLPGEILRYLGESRARRERFRDFLRDLPGDAEEWDRRDVRGTLASVVCTGALALNPRYWAYVSRG